MKAGELLGSYRLIDRLGRGGFAEVWRARPEPLRALSMAPQARLPFLRILAGLLRTHSDVKRASTIVTNLAENLEVLAATQASRRLDAPEAIHAAHGNLVETVLEWAGELAEEGALDLALKIPFHDGYVRQLRREEDLLKQVDHAHLVEQFELDLLHEPPYLAMELVEGWSLRDALRSEALPSMKKILSVMDQLLSVLAHLHRRGLCHGDVKPENILLEQDGTLRLIDLGLGQVSQAVMRDAYLSLSLASRVPLMGTLSYMAPEVRRGETPGAASDLYSAGIVLYEMLVGDVPSGMALPSEAAPERELTPRFDILLKWILHPEPERRIQSAAEFRERVLITLRPRDRHQLGTGRRGKPREGTLDFDKWALEQASPFIQGDWIGAYQLEEPLGRGGFGEVWRAQKDGRGEHLALKIALGPHGKEALEKEADVAGRLDHPLIPSVREPCLEADPPFLVVDYVRGGSLRARLNELGPLDPADAVPLVRSLVDALHHCHQRGVIHRDLKPENLLLDEEEGTLHLLDFGLASTGELPIERPRAELSDTLQTDALQGGGTFEYMAPERRRGEDGGQPADVYSVGVILFEMLTCELPRGLTRLRELCGASRNLEALCEQLLAPDPARRPALPAVLGLLDKERPRRGLFGSRRRMGRKGSAERPRWLVPLAGVGALCVAGITAGLAVSAGHGGTERAVVHESPQPAPPDVYGVYALLQQIDPGAPLSALEAQLDAVPLAAVRRAPPRGDRARRMFRLATLRELRLRSWSAARAEARRLGGRATLTLDKYRSNKLPSRNEAAPFRWLAEQRSLSALIAELDQALAQDPLGERTMALRTKRLRALLAQASWNAQVWAEAKGGHGADTLLVLEGLFPRHPETARRVAAYTGPVRNSWFTDREQLVGRLLQRGDLAGAQAVRHRLARRATSRWAQVLRRVDARLREAAQNKKPDPELAPDHAWLEAQTLAQVRDQVEALLWTELTPGRAPATIAVALKRYPQDPTLRGAAAVCDALRGRFQRVDVALGALHPAHREAFPPRLAELRKASRARARLEAELVEVEARWTKTDSKLAAAHFTLCARLRRARLNEESFGVALREAFSSLR